MKRSGESITDKARKKVDYTIEENEQPPVETKLEQLLVQTETITQEQAYIRDSLNQVKHAIQYISDYMKEFGEKFETVKGGLEALRHQRSCIISNHGIPSPPNKSKVIIDLTEEPKEAKKPASSSTVEIFSSLASASPATKVASYSAVETNSPLTIKTDIPKSISAKRSEIKKLVLEAAQNKPVVADDIYDQMIRIVRIICGKYRKSSKRFGKTAMWEDVDKKTQDKLVQGTLQQIIDNDDRVLFLNNCVDCWPIRFLIQQRWDGWTYYTVRKELQEQSIKDAEDKEEVNFYSKYATS